jgi:hypothetical protein
MACSRDNFTFTFYPHLLKANFIPKLIYGMPALRIGVLYLQEDIVIRQYE